MKKKFLFLMALMAVSLLALAEMSIFVYQKDGEKVEYLAGDVDSIGFVNFHHIVFDANGSEGFMEPLRVKESESVTLPANTFTKSAFAFIGWNTAADGRGTAYVDQATITITANITLFAQWEPMHAITFNANGGEGTMDVFYVKDGESVTLPTNTFTNGPSTFVGWNTATDGSGTAYADQSTITPIANVNLYAQWLAPEHEYVDLGFPSGTKWATCNVGANSPEEYGDYFAWGETTPKSTYNWSNYKWCKGSEDTMTKYCTSSSYGTVDNKTTLDLSDDAAYTNWGSSWRMPTSVEFNYLKKVCTCTWTTQNGVNGYKVTSKINGNSIFLPAAGYRASSLNRAGSYGSYWRSSLSTGKSCYAGNLYFNSNSVISYGTDSRYYGRSVRPVLREIYTLGFDANGGSGSMSAVELDRNESKNIPANTSTRNGYRFTGWHTAADGSGTAYTDQSTITPTTNMTLYAQWKSTTSGIADGHEWVDLGLPSGTKWATMDIGATTSEELGDLFAWGETRPKETYTWSTYKFGPREDNPTKYAPYRGSAFFSDNLLTLLLEDDAAHVNWGGLWRMPTSSEFQELKDNCTSKVVTKNGVIIGYLITSEINGAEIFMSGLRDNSYWSSSLDRSQPNKALVLWNVYVGGGGATYKGLGTTVIGRCFGLYIRPVLPDAFNIQFDSNGGEGAMADLYVLKNQSVGLTQNTFTKVAHNFIGWNTAADGSGTAYTDQSTITPTANMTLYAQWENITSGIADGHEWVDLPSGTLWASCNVGANSPEDYGDYFAWGETTPKSTYDWSTYKWCKGSNDTMTKYCISSSYGTVDNKTTLDLSDDAAYVNWGSSWRMPTKAEQDELGNANYTTWTWTTQNGVEGYKVTSKINGNSIFLPAAGSRYNTFLYNEGSYGRYWSSSLNTYYSNNAYFLDLDSGVVDGVYSNSAIRLEGFSVRPVLRE